MFKEEERKVNKEKLRAWTLNCKCTSNVNEIYDTGEKVDAHARAKSAEHDEKKKG